MATSDVESGVSVSVLSVYESLPVVSLQEGGHKVRVAPVACIVQRRLKVLEK